MEIGRDRLKIAICDDREEERLRFRSLISQFLDSRHLVAEIEEYSSGEALLNADVKKYNLIILDIIMGELNGIETAAKIRELSSEVQIVFCSTTGEYAADSYDVSALYYLIKPVSEEKFYATLDLFFGKFENLRTITYKINRLDETVPVSDVIYIESGSNHTTHIYTKSEEIITRTSLSELMSQLDGADFVVPIRYAAVNLNFAATVPSDVIALSNGTAIPVSRDRRQSTKNAYMEFKRKQLLKKGGFKQ